jgi:hypothetical protein
VVAAAAPSSSAARAPAARPDARAIEMIFACLSPGLPNDWKKAWIVLSGADHAKAEAKFFFTDKAADDRGEPFVPCSAKEVADRVVAFDALLPPERRGWTGARLLINADGEFDLKYDYLK